jgi:hypothetical protein
MSASIIMTIIIIIIIIIIIFQASFPIFMSIYTTISLPTPPQLLTTKNWPRYDFNFYY